MSEAEKELWQTSSDPKLMLQELVRLQPQISIRKAHLYLAAFAQLAYENSGHCNTLCEDAIAIVERYAFNKATEGELRQVRQNITEELDTNPAFTCAQAAALSYAHDACLRIPPVDARNIASLLNPQDSPDPQVYIPGIIRAQLLRDIFGLDPKNSPPNFDPTWLTTTVTALAKSMFESKDASAMPVLADALEEAGCDNADILNYCRSGKVLTSNNWVILGVLGIELAPELPGQARATGGERGR